MTSPLINIHPVMLKVFIEHLDGTFHQVFATPEDAAKLAVWEVMKDTTAYVQIRREDG